MWQHFQIISSAISWLLFIVVSSEGAVVINMFAHASFITPQCVCFIQTKPNALGQPVLLWGRTPLWLLSLLQVGHSPWSPPSWYPRAVRVGTEQHCWWQHPHSSTPSSTAVGTQGLISDHTVGLAGMCGAIKAASFPQGR